MLNCHCLRRLPDEKLKTFAPSGTSEPAKSDYIQIAY
jgi:hypothetical protein